MDYTGGSICSYSSLTMKGDSFHLCVTTEMCESFRQEEELEV